MDCGGRLRDLHDYDYDYDYDYDGGNVTHIMHLLCLASSARKTSVYRWRHTGGGGVSYRFFGSQTQKHASIPTNERIHTHLLLIYAHGNFAAFPKSMINFLVPLTSSGGP